MRLQYQLTMNMQQYLQEKLDSIKLQSIRADEKRMLELGQIDYFIQRRLLSKSFRKNFLKPETKELIRNKILSSIQQDKPIYLIFAFGGYKNHWVEEYHPKAEWAELFHLIYITELLAPIAKVYKPGVFLEYESECEATIYHNNFTRADIDAYTTTFKMLLEFIKQYAPDNLKYNYITLPEQYDTEVFFAKVQKHIPDKVEELRKLYKDNLDEALKRPLFNLKRKGAEDLTNKSEDELKQIALKSLAFNHTFLEEDYKIRKDYFNGDERIAMVGTYCSEEENPDNWIAINSCKRSDNAFWTSRGVMLDDGKTLRPDIIGPKLYEEYLAREIVTVQAVDLGSEDLAYLNSIPVVSL